MIKHWTVVGYYPETKEVYVEHITGESLTPVMAIGEAYRIEPARGEGSAVIIAVFRGHHDDEYGDLGMSTMSEREWHPRQNAIESHYEGEEPFADRCVMCMEAPL